MTELDTLDEFDVQPARVTYVDLAAHDKVSAEEFYGQGYLKTFELFGLVLIDGDIVRIMHCVDVTDNSECEGTVIPRSCVKRIDWLKVEPRATTNTN